MSGILKFQPEDEHTVVARLLLELHSAIDKQFPNANPGGRQFSKTVLTSHAESTRVDNEIVPDHSPGDRANQVLGSRPAPPPPKQASHVSLIHKTGLRVAADQNLMGTDDVRRLIGESGTSKFLRTFLTLTLLAGITYSVWLVFFRESY